MGKKFQAYREPVLCALVLFFISFFVGGLCGRLAVLSMGEKIIANIKAELSLFAYGEVHYTSMFRHMLIINSCLFGSILLAAFCVFGPWYYAFHIVRFGGVVGVLAGQFAGIFHGKGTLLTLAYYVPGWLVYAPVYYSLLLLAYELWRRIFHKYSEGERFLSRREYGIRIVRLFLLLGFGTVLEVWLGSLVLRLAAEYFLKLL